MLQRRGEAPEPPWSGPQVDKMKDKRGHKQQNATNFTRCEGQVHTNGHAFTAGDRFWVLHFLYLYIYTVHTHMIQYLVCQFIYLFSLGFINLYSGKGL